MDKFVKKEKKILAEISNNKRKGDFLDAYDDTNVKIKKSIEDHEYFTLNTGDKMPIGNNHIPVQNFIIIGLKFFFSNPVDDIIVGAIVPTVFEKSL